MKPAATALRALLDAAQAESAWRADAQKRLVREEADLLRRIRVVHRSNDMAQFRALADEAEARWLAKPALSLLAPPNELRTQLEGAWNTAREAVRQLESGRNAQLAQEIGGELAEWQVAREMILNAIRSRQQPIFEALPVLVNVPRDDLVARLLNAQKQALSDAKSLHGPVRSLERTQRLLKNAVGLAR